MTPVSASDETIPLPAKTSVFDPRIDKLVTWALMFAAGVALSIGAWFFSGLQRGMDDLKKEVVDLRVALSKTDADRRDIEELKKELGELRGLCYQLQSQKR